MVWVTKTGNLVTQMSRDVDAAEIYVLVNDKHERYEVRRKDDGTEYFECEGEELFLRKPRNNTGYLEPEIDFSQMEFKIKQAFYIKDSKNR
ncbi:hypothetical protein [Bacillus mycoides]|uniref:hypothetical protein n=1 Tax=Bacillus mycoides TaxID=1405 RepID=UPI003A80EE6A